MLAIVVLQYGGWRDTVSCLQSLVASVAAGHARVIVVDNASTDESVQQVQSWIGGGLVTLARPVHDPIAHHWWPLVGAETEWQLLDRTSHETAAPAAWSFYRAEANNGFASGMNCGLRVALADDRVDTVWLLNNDTVVAPDAIEHIRAALTDAPANVGQFGTTVCYYDRPTIIQSVGWCRWNAWLATSHRVNDGANMTQKLVRKPTATGYVYGASWIIRAAALRDVGLLTEESFLYGEELDWSRRAKPAWGTQLLAKVRVWHREGATIGAGARSPQRRSELIDLCGISARLRLTRRFFPRRLPVVYLGLLGAALNRYRRGDKRRAIAVFRLVWNGGEPAPRPRGAGGGSSSLADAS